MFSSFSNADFGMRSAELMKKNILGFYSEFRNLQSAIHYVQRGKRHKQLISSMACWVSEMASDSFSAKRGQPIQTSTRLLHPDLSPYRMPTGIKGMGYPKSDWNLRIILRSRLFPEPTSFRK
jgi:hypothetical protein